MIPREMLLQKPIDLRHKCLFYIGHIPTFLDMLLAKQLGEPNTEPKRFMSIFERGIDPHVDDPEYCHSHSEVPEKDEDWPAIEEVVAFRDRVRARLLRVYSELDSGTRIIDRRLARVLMMTLEHEGWHVETLLYMLIQRAGTGTLPPPGFPSPDYDALTAEWSLIQKPSTPTITLGPAQVWLGHDDSELDDLLPSLSALSPEERRRDVDEHEFGWDNESPRRVVEVGKFMAEWRPVTNAEYMAFWKGAGQSRPMPTTWVEEDGELKIRTLHGPISFAIGAEWPVQTSYDNMEAYAQHKGGRLPTEAELRLFLDRYEVGHDGGANVGFRNWHPTPATTGRADNDGRGSNGGVWEWTSTLFESHDGLAPTNIFPGYSTDFFDGVHHVVLGASYATIPRIAGRRTVRNFWQHNYPYPWIGARVVYDA
ncbi:hypothetical protein PUNSTDRAFT_105460 [Punctularia strigosozonata HHB-11173 SS5]|uniref:uncharacterized protein n=1 Tax=Punctularia strigosozonata (strain HHB-11173) TaxID=741275 RepID=UPI000441850E|nr:uncharacterized protein PUNSTDRAFT_105460 [Punctularia strigosozonata HHB-11173 SS5]EIN06452.1 hypothetical protein PUNSTDRAFT_105460 [Punctularia strigosozonata HHB-11173 SS5]